MAVRVARTKRFAMMDRTMGKTVPAVWVARSKSNRDRSSGTADGPARRAGGAVAPRPGYVPRRYLLVHVDQPSHPRLVAPRAADEVDPARHLPPRLATTIPRRLVQSGPLDPIDQSLHEPAGHVVD